MRIEVNSERADLYPSAFCWSSTLQHSAVGPFGLTEFPLRSIGCIDNLIPVTPALLQPTLQLSIPPLFCLMNSSLITQNCY